MSTKGRTGPDDGGQLSEGGVGDLQPSAQSDPRFEPIPTTDRLAGFDLRGWFADRGRDLPWRHSRDPWAILVSEVMLQQTQVVRVVERWQPFVDHFPSPRACAGAPQSEVVAWWAGMGFNRRARNLHRAAVAIVAEHDGVVPDTLEGLMALPGVGPYTARAVLVFAYEQSFGVLDTNVARILARTEGVVLGRREAQELADRLAGRAAGGDPWLWNQALLDIGASACRPRPRCSACPLVDGCRWHRSGNPEPDPATGSAGVSVPQTRFEGSDRQGRGRLVDALRTGPVSIGELAPVMGWPDDPDRARRVASGLVTEGLIAIDRTHYRLV